MDRAALLERTKKELRSLLISAPRGVPARMLYKDYKMVIGKELPYRQLGFRNADEFVQSLSDVVRLGFGPTGEQTYFGVANAETAQISRFVASQKKPKLKKSHAPPPTIARTPMRMAAFTRKSHYGPRPYFKGGSTSRGGRPGLCNFKFICGFAVRAAALTSQNHVTEYFCMVKEHGVQWQLNRNY